MLAILGAGGHGRVIADAYDGEYRFFDDGPGTLPPIDYLSYDGECRFFIVGIGDNQVRKDVFKKAAKGKTPKNVIGRCTIVEDLYMHAGTFVNHGAIIQRRARIYRNVIINTGAIVDHDCIVRDHAHIAPGAVLCGGVEIGEGALVGANATVLPNQKVPAWSTVRAGSLYYENPDEQSGHKSGG